MSEVASGAVPKISVVLLSGGLDSSANLALCRAEDLPALALTVHYGQRAAAREISAARALCEYYDVPHRVLELPWLGALGGSSLTDAEKDVPHVESSELDDLSVTRGTARAVWIPNRNGLLINVAAAFAERMGAARVVVGFNREEAATFPDNSGEFLRRASAALELSTSNGIEVSCYTVDLDKTQIVKRLRGLGRRFPFEMVWSCYHGGASPCESCESCQRYRRAVGGAGGA